jgi:hypothetical protein
MNNQKENVSISDSEHTAVAKLADGSLEVRLFNDGTLEIESPNKVGVNIERINSGYKGVIYRINTYIPHPEDKENIHGNTTIYVDSSGQLLKPNEMCHF